MLRSTIVIGPSDVTTPLSTTVGFLGTTRTIQPTNVTAVGAISISAIAAYNLDPNTAYHRKGAQHISLRLCLPPCSRGPS